jgi:hypothetical protein
VGGRTGTRIRGWTLGTSQQKKAVVERENEKTPQASLRIPVEVGH